MTFMKNLLLFIISVLIGSAIVVGYYGYKKNTRITKVLAPKERPTIFSIEKAPSESKKGTIASMSGTVEWESRIATIPAQLTTTAVLIQQGESLTTAEDGQISVSFPDIGSLDVTPKSKVEFTQTLPGNFVVNQSAGMIHYQKTASTPVSIRSLHLLIIMTGRATVMVDKDTGIITVVVNSGTASVGFNDLQYVSHVVDIDSGQKFVFDDTKRTGTLE